MTTPTEAFPKKLFYKINEVAEIVGVEAYVLRYWETKFPMLKPERYGNDERRYRRGDVELLLRIRQLLYTEKFTIAGAVERLKKDPTGALDAEFRNSPSAQRMAAQDAETAQLELIGDYATSEFPHTDIVARLRSIRMELEQLRG